MSPMLLRMAAFERATMALTLLRETLTSEPEAKKGRADILRRVAAASSAAQIRKRRIPTSSLGIAKV